MRTYLCTWLPVALLASTVTNAHESCLTPIKAQGFCVPISQCSYIPSEMMYKLKPPSTFLRYLHDSVCKIEGDTPYMCCDAASVVNTVENTKRMKFNGRIKRAINQRGLDILNRVDCGNRANAKLSGGDETKLAEFPWMALLKYNYQQQPWQCGGSVITERYVLTAAHCVVGIHYNLIGVRLGEHNIKQNPDCKKVGKRRSCMPPSEDFGIVATKAHPQYESGRIINDIALIKIDSNVIFKRHIRPICLPITPNSRAIANDQSFYIAGWGTTEKNEPSDVLLKAIVSQQSLDTCRTAFRTSDISNNHICARGKGIIESCRGDSGGPLFFLVPYKDTTRYTQFGIVSFGGSKCGANEPGIYANVVDMLPWITENID